MPAQLNQLIVTLNQFLEQSLVRVADHRHQHAVLDLHREADVDCRGMHDLVTNQAAGWRAVLGQRHGQGTQRIQGRTGLGMARFSMGQHRIQANGQRDRRQRPRPTAAHRVSHGDAHR